MSSHPPSNSRSLYEHANDPEDSSLISSVLKFFRPLKKKKSQKLFERVKDLELSNSITKDELYIIDNVIELCDKTVEDAMVPRSDIIAVKHNANLDEIKHIVTELPHTRTLVYEDNLDNIIGFIHIKDLFAVIANKDNFFLKKILRQPIVTAPSSSLVDLLAEMQRKRTHIAIVADEYGGTDGIVTIEDIIENIVGSIDDEHESAAKPKMYEIIDENTIIANARVEVEDLEEILNIQLKNEDDEFETIGGLVLAKVGHVPVTGAVIDIDEFVTIEVIDANPRKLNQVKLILNRRADLHQEDRA